MSRAVKPYRTTAMHQKHLALKAKMVEADGWLRPEYYTSPEEEARAARSGVGVCDISPLGKLHVEGEELEAFLREMLPGGFTLRVGQCATLGSPSPDPNQSALCSRITQENLMVVTPIGGAEAFIRQNQRRLGSRVHVFNLTSTLAALRLAGPLSRDVLAKITPQNLAPEYFPNLSCAAVNLAKIRAVIVRRDLEPLPSFELYFGREYGEYVWDVVLDAGKELGIKPFGLSAHERLVRGV